MAEKRFSVSGGISKIFFLWERRKFFYEKDKMGESGDAELFQIKCNAVMVVIFGKSESFFF